MKRRKGFPYKSGQAIEIFTDYQTCKLSEGLGRLISFVSDGLPFILEETPRSNDQIVYCYQTWVVAFGNFTCKRKIRYIKGYGDYSSLDLDLLSPVEKDVFIKVNGKSVF